MQDMTCEMLTVRHYETLSVRCEVLSFSVFSLGPVHPSKRTQSDLSVFLHTREDRKQSETPERKRSEKPSGAALSPVPFSPALLSTEPEHHKVLQVCFTFCPCVLSPWVAVG